MSGETNIHRRELVAAILDDRPAGTLVVASLGSSAWDLADASDDAGDFHFIGAMGQSAPFALGLALAQPTKRVILFAGDGELLMGLGSLATIANQAPPNLAIVAVDNHSYQETGDQPTATAGPTDLEAVARGCGIASTTRVAAAAEIPELRTLVLTGNGPVFALVEVIAEPLPLVFPPSFDGATAMNRFAEAARSD